MLFGALLAAGLAALVASTDASALGIGIATLDSSLGEPLRVSIPITLQSDEDVGCIQVRARGDDLPSVFNTRSNVVRVGSETRIEISSGQPVVEPTIGLVVSVGCTSPVSREFVFFLDPPIVAPRAPAAGETPRSVVEPTIPRRLGRPAPRRPEAVVATPKRASRPNRAPDASATAAVKKPAAPRPAPVVPAPGTIVVEPALPQATKQPTPPPAAQPAPTPSTGNRDRLSVAPQIPAGQAPADKTATGSAAAGAATTAGAPQSAPGPVPTVDGTPAAVAAANAAADVELMAREQALRTQRDALQARINTLTEQIAALRAQTAALTTRNQALEDASISPMWFWLLALLALIALIAAAWMARSYLALKKSLEGSDWWAATQASAARSTGTRADDPRDDLGALDAGTRMSSGIGRPITKPDMRTSHVMSPAPVVSNVERSRPMVRTQTAYPPPIETDFTVSDIEVAMAAVRTVSPPRTQQPKLTDSDLGHLGGPTEPLAFTDPPPGGPSTSGPPVRGPFPTELGGGDSPAAVADMNVPPMDLGPPPGLRSANEADAPSMDFKLEIPQSYDPLESDAYKKTEFERTNPSGPGAFDPANSAAPTSLDFELPTASSIDSGKADAAAEPRHGATALNNLFASTETENLGPDTILDLDDRKYSPLSLTDVAHFTSTTVDNPSGASQATVQGRMSRFADLMTQVDEAATADPLRAIALLRQYVLKDENIPTLLWLRLFELYKAVDKKPVYEALAEHFTRRYHRPMIGWNEKLSDRVPQTPLSSFKELDSQIEASWGMEIGLDRLQALLCGHDQSDAIVFNAVLQRDLLDAAKIFLLDRDSSIAPKA